jgi:hypothetical protein
MEAGIMLVWQEEYPTGNKVQGWIDGTVVKLISPVGDLGEPQPREITDPQLREAFLKKARSWGFPV